MNTNEVLIDFLNKIVRSYVWYWYDLGPKLYPREIKTFGLTNNISALYYFNNIEWNGENIGNSKFNYINKYLNETYI